MNSKASDFAERARKARPAGLSEPEAGFELRSVVPRRHALSYATISRLERGLIEEDRCDIVFLAGLADIYDVPLERISPTAAEEAQKVKRLLERVAPTKRGRRSDQGVPRSRWMREEAA